MALRSNGDAVIVWMQTDGDRTDLRASRYAATMNGNAIAVWSQHHGATFNVYANTYR